MSERPYKNFQIGIFDNPAPKTDPPIRSGKVKPTEPWPEPPKKSLDAYTDLELIERVEELEAKLEKAEAENEKAEERALWDFICEHKLNLFYNDDGPGWEVATGCEPFANILGMDEDPRGAVRKAMYALETELNLIRG